MFSNLSLFTKLHVVISFIGIVSGLVVMFGLLIGRSLNGWTALFLITTVLTSVTGLFTPLVTFRTRWIRAAGFSPQHR